MSRLVSSPTHLFLVHSTVMSLKVDRPETALMDKIVFGRKISSHGQRHVNRKDQYHTYSE